MVGDVVSVVRPAKVSEHNHAKGFIVLEWSPAERDHLLITELCNISAHQTLDMNVYVFAYVLDKHKKTLFYCCV